MSKPVRLAPPESYIRPAEEVFNVRRVRVPALVLPPGEFTIEEAGARMPILLGADRSPLKTIIQIPGEGYRIDVGALREAIEQSRPLHEYLLRFCQAMVAQTAFTTLANVTHPVEVRLARWLLMAHDRTDGHDVALTHEYMGVMLAVRRPSVTTAPHVLEGNRFIKASRGMITIRDRAGLEEFSDGSYGRPEAEYTRLIGPFFG